MVRHLKSDFELRLISSQDPFDIGSALLDDDCRSLDTLEDPSHQGRPFLGMANETCNHCWVCAFVRLFKHLLTASSLPGTPLWIAFTYSNLDKVTDINKYFAPAGW
jgi:hypothetical protein